ncbi:hypothetical protein ABIE45_003736 [Methylobacterium sp. OAE515]|uniref:hypothetical protein n=1 Tax=Methylobacterium sp. OAE515 TaxID=2817895 RepID=UPI001789D338
MLHEPNTSSGGLASRDDAGRFLCSNPPGPQHHELLHLIGVLIEVHRPAATMGGPAPEAGAAAAEPIASETRRAKPAKRKPLRACDDSFNAAEAT